MRTIKGSPLIGPNKLPIGTENGSFFRLTSNSIKGSIPASQKITWVAGVVVTLVAKELLCGGSRNGNRVASTATPDCNNTKRQ